MADVLDTVTIVQRVAPDKLAVAIARVATDDMHAAIRDWRKAFAIAHERVLRAHTPLQAAEVAQLALDDLDLARDLFLARWTESCRMWDEARELAGELLEGDSEKSQADGSRHE